MPILDSHAKRGDPTRVGLGAEWMQAKAAGRDPIVVDDSRAGSPDPIGN
jgi:hypothetical protein